jgi:hypothetical protein
LSKSVRNPLIKISRKIILTTIAGKTIAVVSTNPSKRLYSLQRDKKDSTNKDGFGKIVCVTQVNSNISK